MSHPEAIRYSTARVALALTAAELLAEPGLVEQATPEFERQYTQGEVAGLDAWLEHVKEYDAVQP